MQRNRELKKLTKPAPAKKEESKKEDLTQLRELIGYESMVCEEQGNVPSKVQPIQEKKDVKPKRGLGEKQKP